MCLFRVFFCLGGFNGSNPNKSNANTNDHNLVALVVEEKTERPSESFLNSWFADYIICAPDESLQVKILDN